MSKLRTLEQCKIESKGTLKFLSNEGSASLSPQTTVKDNMNSIKGSL